MRNFEPLLRKVKTAYVRRFRSYSYDELVRALSGVGVARGDTIIVHSRYSPTNGFRETPAQALSALSEAIGSSGTLLMPSSSYDTSTEEYVKTGATFDVRFAPSRMGILSELFRRRKGTLRSINPAHPVLACGPSAEWFISGHEDCLCSCGPGSPFEKLIEKNAKALFFDTRLSHLMFFHYLEHTVQDFLKFPLFDSDIYSVRVLDGEGRERFVKVLPFPRRVRTRRRFSILESELRRRGMIRRVRVGNTRLMLVNIRDTLRATQDLSARGIYFYSKGRLSFL